MNIPRKLPIGTEL